MSNDVRKETIRNEIADLYFWLGEEAERVGFTPWQTAFLARQEPLGEPVLDHPSRQLVESL